MGPTMKLLGGSILWMCIFCIVIIAVGFLINRFWMYKGPEDEDKWNENEEDNFKMH